MHTIHINSYSLPLVREIGFMHDKKGIYRHPDRKMEKINVFVFVIRGSIHVFEDGTEYRLTQGSYLFLKKDISHWGGDFYEPGTSWFYIHFYNSPETEKNEEDTEFVYFPKSSLIYEDTYETKLCLPKCGRISSPEFFVTKLKNLVTLYETPHPLRPIQLSLSTYQLFTVIYSGYIEEQNNSKNHVVINQMIEMLTNSEREKLTGEEIADSLGMNYAYLSTLFKKHTGKSVKRYQNEILIEKAVEMFRKNAGNVTEVSDALGFSNPFYFSRVFKKITGVSPTTYISESYKY
ncbi:AraC family transcriptional regulator [Litchfieldia alkalitelluris]|uniref:AraC family transcriptional regulator n=1 Tax=Litchfieldia alkalitelluris TaxID=304268 RepID=UPI0009963A41|nr:AraC family transcriptional regulator [Litchfieldia alkalitelluris]